MKQCPFCRNAFLECMKSDQGSYYVFCRRCGCTGPRSIDREIAIFSWNDTERNFNCKKCKKDKKLNYMNLCKECET